MGILIHTVFAKWGNKMAGLKYDRNNKKCGFTISLENVLLDIFFSVYHPFLCTTIFIAFLPWLKYEPWIGLT
jgi:hypothetical protein